MYDVIICVLIDFLNYIICLCCYWYYITTAINRQYSEN